MLLSFPYISFRFYADLILSFDFTAFWFHFASMLLGSGWQTIRKASLTVSTRHRQIWQQNHRQARTNNKKQPETTSCTKPCRKRNNIIKDIIKNKITNIITNNIANNTTRNSKPPANTNEEVVCSKQRVQLHRLGNGWRVKNRSPVVGKTCWANTGRDHMHTI